MSTPENDRCLQILKNMFGETEPKKIKFKELEKGANQIRVINPLSTPIRHFGSPSPSDPLSVHVERQNSNIPVFLRIGQGDSVQIRMISEAIPHYQSFQVGGEVKKCKRYLTYVVDRGDNNIKVWSFGKMIFQKIQIEMAHMISDPFRQDMRVSRYLNGRFPSYNISFFPPTQLPSFQSLSLVNLRALIEASPRMSFNP